MGARSEALAKRVEQGAESLAQFAETLSDAQWRSTVAPDGRQAGVIIHHVASMYPIEIDLASVLASGKHIEGVTWDIVAGINEKHAREHAAIGRDEAPSKQEPFDEACAEPACVADPWIWASALFEQHGLVIAGSITDDLPGGAGRAAAGPPALPFLRSGWPDDAGESLNRAGADGRWRFR